MIGRIACIAVVAKLAILACGDSRPETRTVSDEPGSAAIASPSFTSFGPNRPSCPDSVVLPTRPPIGDIDSEGRVRLDRSKPVIPKAEIISAWRQRQDRIKSFRFEWTETQCHWRGWMPNPRYAERERLATPALRRDRTFTVAKTLSVDGNTMNYSFTFERGEEPDGVLVKSPTGDSSGLGQGVHYSYANVFDGRSSETRVSSLTGSPPPVSMQFGWNVDAQNLDIRPMMIAFRPLDDTFGELRLDRSVTNQARFFYKGRSTHLLEERADPMGWKTILWVEPESDFRVTRFAVIFEQQRIVDMEIDYREDVRWGWVPSGWRVIEMLADGTRRMVSTATVTSYTIN